MNKTTFAAGLRNLIQAGAIAALMYLPTVTLAADTPIDSSAVAARGALQALYGRQQVTGLVHTLDFEAREIIERGLWQLQPVTTASALMAAPNGVVVDCPRGGTLTARMTRRAPRVIKFEWAECGLQDLTGLFTIQGPAEATLPEATLAPATILGIRVGDGSRDFQESRPRRPGSVFGETAVRRNQRITGIIPQRQFDYENIPGRFTYEVSGFIERTQMLPSFSGGVPSVELYPFVSVTYAERALVSRERTSGYDTNGEFFFREDLIFAWGTLGNRLINPQRPTAPASTRTNEFRGLGLRVQNFSEGLFNGFEINGRMQVNALEIGGLAAGCGAGETFSFRTRSRAVSPPNLPVPNVFESGRIDVNSSMNLQLSYIPSSTDNIFEARSRVDVTARGLPPASYTVGFDGLIQLMIAGRCAP